MSECQNYKHHTLCWDCAKAIGDCSWSRSLIPIKGWKAIPTYNGCPTSYIVRGCPEFIRDAQYGGLKRYRKEDNQNG